MNLPFRLESDLERAVAADPEWQAGAAWGVPRPGHPEGSVAAHVADVLANVDRVSTTAEERARLRLIALVHDAFKHKVDETKSRTGENHHGTIARRFAERFTSDREVLDVIELHDEAYNAWLAFRDGREKRARQRLEALLKRLGPALGLYRRFFEADNGVPGKSPGPRDWFEAGLISF